MLAFCLGDFRELVHVMQAASDFENKRISCSGSNAISPTFPPSLSPSLVIIPRDSRPPLYPPHLAGKKSGGMEGEDG